MPKKKKKAKSRAKRLFQKPQRKQTDKTQKPKKKAQKSKTPIPPKREKKKRNNDDDDVKVNKCKPTHLFEAWMNPNKIANKLCKLSLDSNIKCKQKNCGNIHFKVISDKYIIAFCHFESCNICDSELHSLSLRLKNIFFNLFCQNDKKCMILLQIFLKNNCIESKGLMLLLNVVSFPFIYLEHFSLSGNAINYDGAVSISHYLSNCFYLPHCIDLSQTKVANKGISQIIKGMIKRRQIAQKDEEDKMMVISLIEFEQRYKALTQCDEDIISGVAINESDRRKLYVPLCLIVDKLIDAKNLALNATQNIFVCTGADYKYIGHGECNKNYCAVTATMCIEDVINNDKKDKMKKIDVCNLPLIHLFIDEEMQCIEGEEEDEEIESETECLWKWEDLNDSNGDLSKTANNTQTTYLSLLLDEDSLKYLLSTPWNIKDSVSEEQDVKEQKSKKAFNPFTDDVDANKRFEQTLAECEAIKNPYVDSAVLTQVQSQFSPSKNEQYIRQHSVKENEESESVMDHILERWHEKSNDEVKFCIGADIFERYQAENAQFVVVLNACINANILRQTDDIDGDLIKLTKDNIEKLHKKLFDPDDGGMFMWDKAFVNDCAL